jgi:outer membrane protein OmpA-like peptidoglycan-associated protein
MIIAICMVVLPAHWVGASEVIGAEDIMRQLAPTETRTWGVRKIRVEYTRIALPAIEFEFDSARLTGQAERQLAELAKALNLDALRSAFFAVKGHTDSKGSETYNRALSLRRADAVKHHLSQERGLSPDRLVVTGLGEGFPIPGLPPDDGRNRRVEIVNLGATPLVVDPEEPRRPVRTKRALLIGIDDYRQVSRLEGPVNDAIEMKSFLVDGLQYAESDVKMLINQDATRANILASIDDWLITPTASGDEIFLFFSGHGFQQPDDNNDEADGLDETWVPVDVFLEAGDEGSYSIRGMITDDEIDNRLQRLAGRQVHVVIDSCHSGTATRNIRDIVGGDWRYVKTPRLPDGEPLRVELRVEKGVRQQEAGTLYNPDKFVSDNSGVTAWAAVRADQKALVDQEAVRNPGSVFTRRLLWGARDGRADANRDGVVTRSELRDYLLEESLAYCERFKSLCKLGLTPQLSGSMEQLEQAAFGRAHMVLPRAGYLAKDILVTPSSLNGVPDEDRVRVRMRPGVKVAVETTLDIIVDSDRDGYLVVLDVDAAGRLVQVFPNELSINAGLSNRIRAGQPLTLPGKGAGFRFRAKPPTGNGVLVAVVYEENPGIQKLTSKHKDLSVVARPEAYLVELAEALRSGVVEQTEERAEWIMGKMEYEIVTQQGG